MISPQEALERLKEGNSRHVAGRHRLGTGAGAARRHELTAGQEPFAVVVGCSDSRVPVEVVFDQGLGDLFVVRVAGNVVTPAQVGSVEYAVARLGARLVVVLGHSRCGAVLAVLDELKQPSSDLSPGLRAIVECIRPSVETLLGNQPPADREALLQQAVRANVRASAERLRDESSILGEKVRQGTLVVACAEYELATGVVAFFDGKPAGQGEGSA